MERCIENEMPARGDAELQQETEFYGVQTKSNAGCYRVFRGWFWCSKVGAGGFTDWRCCIHIYTQTHALGSLGSEWAAASSDYVPQDTVCPYPRRGFVLLDLRLARCGSIQIIIFGSHSA